MICIGLTLGSKVTAKILKGAQEHRQTKPGLVFSAILALVCPIKGVIESRQLYV